MGKMKLKFWGRRQFWTLRNDACRPPSLAGTLPLSWNIGTLEQNRVFLFRIKYLRCSNQRNRLEQMEQTAWNKAARELKFIYKNDVATGSG